jgi:threonine dehydratase
MLATLTSEHRRAGGNIIDVTHNRLALDVPAKGAEFDVHAGDPRRNARAGDHGRAGGTGLPARPAPRSKAAP